MRGLKRLAALMAVLLLGGLFGGVSAPGAVAGGPTSVLITSPESGETTALYNSDKDYTELMRQLGNPGGPAPQTTGPRERPASLDGELGLRQINVTWMVHDVDPWWVDQVFPSKDPSEVWIYSSSRTPQPREGFWHRAKQPAALHALLKRLGLMGEKTGDGSAIAPSQPPTEASRPEAEAAQAPTARAGTEDGARAAADNDAATVRWWAIPALAVGIALGLVLRPLSARLPRLLPRLLSGRLPRPPSGRRGEPDAGPRQQLLDAPDGLMSARPAIEDERPPGGPGEPIRSPR